MHGPFFAHAGWFVDKYGPRLVMLIGGILCAVGWAINAQATSLNGSNLGMIIAGIGAGGVLRRQRAEMVSRQARPCGRHHRRRFRRGLGADGRPDPGDDQAIRLPDHLPLFRSRARHHNRDPRLIPVLAESRTGARGDAERQRHPDKAHLSADRGDPSADRIPRGWARFFCLDVLWYT